MGPWLAAADDIRLHLSLGRGCDLCGSELPDGPAAVAIGRLWRAEGGTLVSLACEACAAWPDDQLLDIIVRRIVAAGEQRARR